MRSGVPLADHDLDLLPVDFSEALVALQQFVAGVGLSDQRVELVVGGHLRENVESDGIQRQLLQPKHTGVVRDVPGQVLAIEVDRGTD